MFFLDAWRGIVLSSSVASYSLQVSEAVHILNRHSVDIRQACLTCYSFRELLSTLICGSEPAFPPFFPSSFRALMRNQMDTCSQRISIPPKIYIKCYQRPLYSRKYEGNQRCRLILVTVTFCSFLKPFLSRAYVVAARINL